MKALVLALLLGLVGISAKAQELPNPAIEAVISNQFEAFRQDDFAKAFSFASPVIKGVFQTSERFGQMVRNGYPMVWRAEAVKYLDLRRIDGRLYQMVMVTDKAGLVFYFDYEMVETPDGWQINGVQELRAPGVNA